jgi:hypothetical protein
VPLLFDCYFCPGRRLNEQNALAMLFDCGVRVLCRFLSDCRRYGAQENDAEVKTPREQQAKARVSEHTRSVR